jgi:hypothetical protein
MADTKVDGRTAAGKAARASIETKDVEGPKATTVMMEGDVATENVERPDLAIVTDEDINSPTVKEYIKDLKFNEDILTFSIGESTDKNAENPVPAGVQGQVKHFTRGVEYKAARKFVDSLIKREDSIKTVNYKDKDNVDQTKIEKLPAMKYALSIHHDPANDDGSKLGSRWFQHQCKNAW